MMGKRQPPRSALAAMEKRVPRNPKYEGVESRLNTGNTIDRVKMVSARQYLKRQDESFLRITPPQLYELFSEYESDGREDVANGSGIGGGFAGGGPVIVTHESEDTPEYDRPYLLLDVRAESEFAAGHILQARSFPAVMLRQDRMITEVYNFKNRDGKLIILYDENELVPEAAQCAARLSERGFENVFVLTKGIAGFALRFPSYVEGKVPEQPVPSTASSSRGGTGRSRGTPQRRRLSGGQSPHAPSTYGSPSRQSQGASPDRQYPSIASSAGRRTPNTSRSHNAGIGGGSSGGSEYKNGSPQESRGQGYRDYSSQYQSPPGQMPNSSRRNRMGTGQSNSNAISPYHGGRRGGGRGGAAEDEEDLKSQMSNISVADSVISRAAQRKSRGGF